MQQNQVCTVLLLVVLTIQLINAEWLKKYEENYHRPTYYNKAHSRTMHVAYNQKLLDQRDVETKTPRIPLPEFDPNQHTSFYVNIMHKGSVMCAGALITRRMVITSAFCFQELLEEFKAEDITVLTGKDLLERTKASQVLAIFMPPPIESGQPIHNVALVALAKKLLRRGYRYIPLHSRMPAAGAAVTMSFYDHKTHEIAFHETKVLKMDICRQSYEIYAEMPIPQDEALFCVTNRKKDGCSTRPGDPLIIDNKLAGINMHGEHCDELEGGNLADVYFATWHSVKFIQTATDLLRAFTRTGPYNSSFTTPRTSLYVTEDENKTVVEKSD